MALSSCSNKSPTLLRSSYPKVLATAAATPLTGRFTYQFLTPSSLLLNASIRPGRFDALLFVGTPNLEARLSRLRDQLQGSPALSPEAVEEAEAVLRPFLADKWETQLQFLNYSENEALLVG